MRSRAWPGCEIETIDVDIPELEFRVAANLGREVEHYIHAQYFAFVR